MHLENYGMALIQPDILEQAFSDIASSETIVAEFSEVIVPGPAVQILPLMVYV